MSARIYFYFSAMNAGKTTALIQNAYNYQERGMVPIIFKPSIDNREGQKPRVISRIGLEMPATIIDCNDDAAFGKILEDILLVGPAVVLVDEIQFFSVNQMKMLEDLADIHDIPVVCYGLRNSFNNEGFPATDWLMRNADKITEIKNICFCGSKATHNLMVVDGKPVKEADSAICVGGNELYHAVCRKHFKAGQYKL